MFTLKDINLLEEIRVAVCFTIYNVQSQLKNRIFGAYLLERKF